MAGSTVQIEGGIAENRANWDERAEIHVASEFYDVDGFVRDPKEISPVVRRDLEVLAPHLPGGTVRGRSLLHLQCHIGTDTVSWHRLGAVNVHGLDFSPNSLRHAREIAERCGADVTFVEGDARFASDEISGAFDVVVTSAGTIIWLPELTAWAGSIVTLLAPGGVFAIRDDHPILRAMDYAPWTVDGDYLGGRGNVYEDDSSYTDGGSGQVEHVRNHEWGHDLSEVVGALRGAGLEIEALGEHPVTDWPAFDGLISDDAGGWVLPEGAPRIPLTFSIVARKPMS